MDSPVRKMQKRNDYNRHKLLRKIKRRRERENEKEQHIAEKQLRKKLRITPPKFEDGKITYVDDVRMDPDSGMFSDDKGNIIGNSVVLPDLTVRPQAPNTNDKFAYENWLIKEGSRGGRNFNVNQRRQYSNLMQRLANQNEVMNTVDLDGTVYNHGNGALEQVSPEFDALMLGRNLYTDGVTKELTNAVRNRIIRRPRIKKINIDELKNSFDNFRKTAIETGYMNPDGTMKPIDGLDFSKIKIPDDQAVIDHAKRLGSEIDDFASFTIDPQEIQAAQTKRKLEEQLAKFRVNAAPDTPIPQEVIEDFSNQVLSRMVANRRSSGAQKVYDYFDDELFWSPDDLSNPKVLQRMGKTRPDITLKDLEDYTQHQELRTALERMLRSDELKYLQVNPKDIALAEGAPPNWGGDFDLLTDVIRVAKRPGVPVRNKTVFHEIRHLFDKYNKLTPREKDILEDTYGPWSMNVRGSEFVTTNAELRNAILEKLPTVKGGSNSIQNKYIDLLSDDEIIQKLSNVNGYGDTMHQNLLARMQAYPQLADKIKKDFAENLRLALKYVPGLAAPAAIATTTNKQSIQQPGKYDKGKNSYTVQGGGQSVENRQTIYRTRYQI